VVVGDTEPIEPTMKLLDPGLIGDSPVSRVGAGLQFRESRSSLRVSEVGDVFPPFFAW